MSPDQGFVRQNLRLMIEQAQLALLRGGRDLPERYEDICLAGSVVLKTPPLATFRQSRSP